MNTVDSPSDDELARLATLAVALPDAPEALVSAAIGLWPATTPSPAAAPSLVQVAQSAWRLVLATLTFDSWSAPEVAWGVRAAGSDTRHLLFSAQGRDIDLRISPTLDHFSVTGQILGPDTSGSIELVTEDADAPAPSCAHAVPLDAFGEFRLDGVRDGTYRMTLRMSGDEIVLPPIVIGRQPR